MERVLALAEDAGLVAALPRRDRLLRLEARDHAFEVTPLPHERVRVAERVAVRERRRDVVAKRHLPGEERHDEADAVLLGEVAEFLEMLHHALVHARAAAGGVRQRLLRVEHPRLVHLVEVVAAQVAGVDGLEVRPVGEHAQDAEAVRGEDAQVLVHGLRVPLAPHLGGGVARPVVRAQRHPPRGQEGGRLRSCDGTRSRAAVLGGIHRRRECDRGHHGAQCCSLHAFSDSLFVVKGVSPTGFSSRPDVFGGTSGTKPTYAPAPDHLAQYGFHGRGADIRQNAADVGL